MPMLMIYEEIDIDPDFVHIFCIDLLKMIDQARLVDVLL